MTTLNLVREPLRTTPFLIQPPRPALEINARSQKYTAEQVAALLQHKDTLLREVHHRVGNSLQIIASMLALDARKVHSEEARVHLENAHRRILAVATVQQQFQISREGGDFELAAYLRQLCENLTASVVSDATRIAIDVRADAGTVSSAVAMNMGLIVTELVINALKHAFAADGAGRITVTYRVQGQGWQLTVSDNGVGNRDGDHASAGTGLGTRIVAELVRQLDGREEISTNPHGRSVSVTHGVFSESLQRPPPQILLARSQGPRSHLDIRDSSVLQARWLLVPAFALFMVAALVRALVPS